MALFYHLFLLLVVLGSLLIASISALPVEQCLVGKGSCHDSLDISIASTMQKQPWGLHGQTISAVIIGGIAGLSIIILGLYLLLRKYKPRCTRHQPTRGVLPGPRIPTGTNVELSTIRAYVLSNRAPASPRDTSPSTILPMVQKRHAIIKGPLYVSWDQEHKALNRENALRMLGGDIPAPSEAHARDSPRVAKEKMFKALLSYGFSVEYLEDLYHVLAAQRGRETYILLEEDGTVVG